jgi:hypothetical protein
MVSGAVARDAGAKLGGAFAFTLSEARSLAPSRARDLHFGIHTTAISPVAGSTVVLRRTKSAVELSVTCSAFARS